MVTTAPGEKKTPHRAPPCEELDAPYDIELVFAQKVVTFVLRKINKNCCHLHFSIPTCIKSFVGWAFVPDLTCGAIQRSPDPQLYLGGLLLKSNLTVGATKSYVTVL